MKNQIVELSFEEMSNVYGGRTPKELLHDLGDWVAEKIGWMVAMEGARVAGSAASGGNVAAVVAFK